MSKPSEIFEQHYRSYCKQIQDLDFGAIHQKLGLDLQESGRMVIPFFDRTYQVSSEGIRDPSGRAPNYMICVILSKYLLMCPDEPHENPVWVTFKDFKRTSHFLNVSYFTSDVEGTIVKSFSGRLDALERACEKLGGCRAGAQLSYDLSMRFEALPRISLLLLFNDSDDEFPAQCSVLFPQHAEHYLDPESLAMAAAVLAKRLAGACPESGATEPNP